MALYTRKGDKGDTSFFSSNKRFSKNSSLAEALGSIDEINSFLGLCKVRAQTYADFTLTNADNKLNIFKIIEQVQNNLFIIQANLAGCVSPKADADKKINKEKIERLEKIIDAIEKELPAVKSFYVSGGAEFSALLDYTRAMARRAERRVVAYYETQKEKSDAEILTYLNRLSSLLYALARFVNLKSGEKENSPDYQ